MKRWAKVIISLGWFAAGVLSDTARRLVGARRKPRLVILCYHAAPVEKKHLLETQLDHIKESFPVLAADTDVSKLAQDAVALTFDDAFESVARIAIPMLRTRGLTATVFVPAGAMGSPPGWAFDGGSGDQREVVASAAELRGLDANTVSFGSHTLTHPRLSTLADAALEAEVAQSRAVLEGELARPIRTMAFPHGDHDERVVRACLTNGYTLMYSITPTPVFKGFNGVVRGRVTVEPDDPSIEFFLKVRGAYAWMAQASALKTRMIGKRRPAAPAAGAAGAVGAA